MALFKKTRSSRPTANAESAPFAEPAPDHCTAFAGTSRIAAGRLPEVARAARAHLDAHAHDAALIFDDRTGRVVEIDLRGTPDDVARRIEEAGADRTRSPRAEAVNPTPRGPGRPKLGVVAREVTLLPRHWDWLSRQPGGASVALRKLVEDARKSSGGRDRRRQAQESAYRFMVALAGDLPGFEEATRALFAGDAPRFAREAAAWPGDVLAHATRLAAAAFDDAS